jgi:hypothetical protein
MKHIVTIVAMFVSTAAIAQGQGINMTMDQARCHSWTGPSAMYSWSNCDVVKQPIVIQPERVVERAVPVIVERHTHTVREVPGPVREVVREVPAKKISE